MRIIAIGLGLCFVLPFLAMAYSVHVFRQDMKMSTQIEKSISDY